jgi:hypothetical protein
VGVEIGAPVGRTEGAQAAKNIGKSRKVRQPHESHRILRFEGKSDCLRFLFIGKHSIQSLANF